MIPDRGRPPLQSKAGDILLLPGNPRHVMHDGSGATLLAARNRAALNFTISVAVLAGRSNRPRTGIISNSRLSQSTLWPPESTPK